MKKSCTTKSIITLVLASILGTANLVFAQSGSTTNVRNYNVKNSQWNEINVQGIISKKFNYQLDIQYRRQSDQVKNGQRFTPNLDNIEKNAYQLVFRPWLHYFPTESRKLRLSISPLGWWGTNGNGEDGYNGGVTGGNSTYSDNLNANLNYSELRSSYQVTTYDQIGRVRLQYRARFELRWIGNGQNSPGASNSGFDEFNYTMQHNTFKTRLRGMVRADIALSGQTIDENEFYVAASNELFVGFSHKTNEGSLIDQNRAYLGIGYKFRKDTRLEIGYLNQMNPKEPVYNAATNVSTSQVDFNNVLQVLLMFDNFNRFFERKIITPPAQ